MLEKTKIMLRKLQYLVDSLNVCAKAILSTKAFNRLYCNAMCRNKHPRHFIGVTSGMK